MSIKKFINNAKESLGLDKFKKAGEKKSIKRLLKKLNSKKAILDTSTKKKLTKEEKKILKEELAIITLQIKKGEKILNKLKAKDLPKEKSITPTKNKEIISKKIK